MHDTLDKLVCHIVHTVAPEKVILFGSIASGKNNVFSDIDLLIVTEQTCKKCELERTITCFAREFSLKADVLLHSQGEVERAASDSNSFLSSVIKNGKVLYEKNA